MNTFGLRLLGFILFCLLVLGGLHRIDIEKLTAHKHKTIVDVMLPIPSKIEYGTEHPLTKREIKAFEDSIDYIYPVQDDSLYIRR